MGGFLGCFWSRGSYLFFALQFGWSDYAVEVGLRKGEGNGVKWNFCILSLRIVNVVEFRFAAFELPIQDPQESLKNTMTLLANISRPRNSQSRFPSHLRQTF